MNKEGVSSIWLSEITILLRWCVWLPLNKHTMTALCLVIGNYTFFSKLIQFIIAQLVIVNNTSYSYQVLKKILLQKTAWVVFHLDLFYERVDQYKVLGYLDHCQISYTLKCMHYIKIRINYFEELSWKLPYAKRNITWLIHNVTVQGNVMKKVCRKINGTWYCDFLTS